MIDLIGKDNGFFEIIGYSHLDSKRRCHIWKCKCKCGNIVLQDTNCFIKVRRRSCRKCKPKIRHFNNKYALKHGYTKLGKRSHPLYEMRNRIMTRCYNAKPEDYPYYQGKNIKMYDEWRSSPKSFIEWGIKNGWKKGLTIDRISSDRDYEPNNCRFISLSDNLKGMHDEKKKK